LNAPYGIYKTADGYIALAMMDINTLAEATGCKMPEEFSGFRSFAGRDEIKAVLAEHLSFESTAHWLTRLKKEGLWAMEVFDWEKMMEHEAYKVLGMEQIIKIAESSIITTRCPIRINGKRLYSGKPAPKLGEHNEKVEKEMVSGG
jgi:crotonobetainyl-CoA:carnitine CoA-transferase CaiB-like acyl-CoA transferase